MGDNICPTTSLQQYVYSCRCTFGCHCTRLLVWHVTRLGTMSTTFVWPGLPLKDRVFRSKLVAGNLILSSPHGRPLKYKSYSHNQLHLALQAVSKGSSIRRAAEIPRSTLHDHVSGRVQVGKTSGPAKYLSDEEESDLVEFLSNCAKIGYARTRKCHGTAMFTHEKIGGYGNKQMVGVFQTTSPRYHVMNSGEACIHVRLYGINFI